MFALVIFPRLITNINIVKPLNISSLFGKYMYDIVNMDSVTPSLSDKFILIIILSI